MDGTLIFPRTKLHAPRVHADILPRSRLNALIQRALPTARVVLVSAPAGSGKTTLLVNSLSESATLVAWLRLDGDDNDPMRFLQALVATVGRIAPASSARAAALLAEGAAVDTRERGATARLALTTLLNDLPSDGPRLTLALDDLHTITAPEVYTLLDHAIEHLPDGVTLLITTRHDPPLALLRLRMRRELLEIRLPDLRFRADEAQALLNERLRLGLPAADVAALHARTEGWIAGLSMLASSLERIPAAAERSRFLAHLQHTDRYIFDYLAEEVLNRQEPFVRMFLLETAVLLDLTPARCAALTGREDAAAILEDLERRNLFLVALDGEQGAAGAATYRYHDLFRAFLLGRLQREHPQWLARLHRRAAAGEPDAGRRIGHLLAAEAWEEAAAAIVAAAPHFAAQSAHEVLRSWIMALPEAVCEARPWLTFWRALGAAQSFHLAEAQALLEQALERFSALGDREGESAALARLAILLTQIGDWGAAQAAMERAAAHQLSIDDRIAVSSVQALQALVHGQWRQTLASFDTMIDAAASADSAKPAVTVVAVLSGVLATLPGSLPRMDRLAGVMERLARDDRDRLALLEIRLHTLPWRGRWDEARAAFRELSELGARLGTLHWTLLRTAPIAAHDAALRGDHAGAEAVLSEMLAQLGTSQASAGLLDVLYHCWRGYQRWLSHDIAGLRADAQQIVALEQRYGQHPYTAVASPFTRALLALAEERYDAAAGALDEMLALQERLRYTTLLGDARVLRGHLHLRRGEPERALAAFAPALAESAEAGLPGYLMWQGAIVAPLLQLAVARDVERPFASHTLDLLATLRPAQPERSPAPLPSGESLTDREVEVLRILATGASNTEIAARLVISPHTAKRHVANVLAKLAATTRTEAAGRARDLGLI
jgi:LuxR family maltose regulon positive regulatory protein